MLLTVKKERKPSTPWGSADTVTEIAPGIRWYSTPSHGGVRLLSGRRKELTAKLQRKTCDEWWEEDTAYSVPALCFPELMQYLTGDKKEKERLIRGMCRDWYPLEYTLLTGEETTPDNSYLLRKRKWEADHAKSWVGVSAWGEWAAGVSKGKVGVIATLGGINGGAERHFLVEKKEYAARSSFGYVIQAEDVEVPVGTFKFK